MSLCGTGGKSILATLLYIIIQNGNLGKFNPHLSSQNLVVPIYCHGVLSVLIALAQHTKIGVHGAGLHSQLRAAYALSASCMDLDCVPVALPAIMPDCSLANEEYQ